jgi:hypothetical protein
VLASIASRRLYSAMRSAAAEFSFSSGKLFAVAGSGVRGR